MSVPPTVYRNITFTSECSDHNNSDLDISRCGGNNDLKVCDLDISKSDKKFAYKRLLVKREENLMSELEEIQKIEVSKMLIEKITSFILEFFYCVEINKLHRLKSKLDYYWNSETVNKEDLNRTVSEIETLTSNDRKDSRLFIPTFIQKLFYNTFRILDQKS